MQRNQLNINLAQQSFGSTNGEYYTKSILSISTISFKLFDSIIIASFAN